MEKVIKQIGFIRFAAGTIPTACDLWLMIATLIAVFGKTVPWYVWVMVGLELLSIGVGAARMKKEELLV